ncbi:hypothetical protein [uncultured Phascolarctobacterium sp.]|jgi:hypothetical protein|uniref:hypothetical protein n=1 Tax=uncultured Phascolarctobacterium sp. TaxID=512296 RepID=UPI00205A6A9C|nr:hypothetical protein [uncultured Phascolarctobacterium sp.]DAL12090.1 MAG TPA_asm: hypothetical protein [Bacteriophage sp.]
MKSNLFIFTFGLLLGASVTYCLLPINSQPAISAPPTNTISSTANLKVTPKETTAAPDLIVEQKYIATINQKKVEVPIYDKTTPASASTAYATPYTATLQQEIDVTPLVNHMVPKWEIGIGIGRHKSNTYIPVAVQRNYTYNKAVQMELHIDPSDHKISGVEIQHKWRF